MTTTTAGTTTDDGVGAIGAFVLVAVLATVAVLDLIAILQLWPSTDSSGALITSHRVLGSAVRLSADGNIMVVAVLSGTLGASIHSIKSAVWYVGQRQLRWRWVLFYLTLPVIAAALGLFFYWLLRGGLVTGAGSVDALSPYGVAAIAALVGLFSEQALQMLLNVFETLFTQRKRGNDSTPLESA